MIAFEIFVNGEKRLTIGGEEYPSFTVVIGLLQEPLPNPNDTKIELAAVGITTDLSRVGTWPILSLAVGNQVEVRIVDIEAVDEPEFVQILEKGDENVDG